MDARTVESRLQQIADGAEMISYTGLKKYFGKDYQWIRSNVIKAGNINGVGNNHGQIFSIHDVARFVGD